MILLAIVAATVAGGLLSVLAAATLSLTLLRRYANLLLSFAVGILLAATFLNLLPEALAGLPATTVGATLLISLILLFMLEKSLLWRHHHQRPERSDAGLKAGAAMVVVGDGLHNFVDGVLIAAAFLHDPALGWATATAVILHEIPQEVGDFMVLLAAGYSRGRALLLNLLSGAGAVVGGLIGYFTLSAAEQAIPYALAVAAATFLYVAIADLIPALQRHHRLRHSLGQCAMLLLGVGVIVAS